MDSLRGQFDTSDAGDEDFAVNDTLPAAIGTDERRMQVRAYNFWAGLLHDRSFPSVEDLTPETMPDFAPFSVLLDFSTGIENPGISWLGESLAEECGASGNAIAHLADVPSRSLLSRITDHYMQILANQAPIGFEAEFVNQRGLTILYRGILLPFSSDDDTIDFIYGVINWKELAEQSKADELLLEIDQALTARQPLATRRAEPLSAWADGPATSPGAHLPRPSFGMLEDDAQDEPFARQEPALPDWPDMAADLPAADAATDDMGLADWLAAARELAQAASGSEDRTRAALYGAIGHAYDFSLAAQQSPEEFAELLADAGLTVQERAPMTPVVKLVFGAEYDKTRLTEYAAALTHAHRLALPRGCVAQFLRDHDGGLKGVVKAERALRRDETGKPGARREGPGKTLARKLRALPEHGFDAIHADGSEFALVLIRRDAGEVAVLGEVPDDTALVQRAAKHLLA